LMPPALAAFIAREVAAGLAYAHQLAAPGGKSLGSIHRDVSPSNIMLLRAGGVKLLDFGIAKASAALQDGGHTTATGQVKGKLSYLSPEQVKHEPVDLRTDIFSLGVVLWECLTGKRLFHDRSDYHTMNNVLSRTVPPPSSQQMGVPEELDAIVLKMLERDRDSRMSHAKTVVEELDQFLVAHPLRPRMLPRLLDELFGPDGHELESVPAAGARTADEETPVMTAVMLPSIPSVTSITAVAGGNTSRTDALLPAATSGGSPAPAKASPRIWPWAAGAVLVVAAFAAGRLVRPPSFETATTDTRGIVAIPRGETGTGVRGTATPLPTEAPPTAGQAPDETGAAKIAVRVESDPSGAEVTGPKGVLGTTPLTVDLPRGSQPVTLTLRKAGFEPSRQTIVPERDTNALVSLRASVGDSERKSETAKTGAKAGEVAESAKIDPVNARPASRRLKAERGSTGGEAPPAATEAAATREPAGAPSEASAPAAETAKHEGDNATEPAKAEAAKAEAAKPEATKAEAAKPDLPKAESKPAESTPPVAPAANEADPEKPAAPAP
ncbi:MAG TPA: serine/threonine-protein kinase, partial [Polyangia bacterium]